MQLYEITHRDLITFSPQFPPITTSCKTIIHKLDIHIDRIKLQFYHHKHPSCCPFLHPWPPVVNDFFWGHMCSFLLGKYYLELEQLDCMVNVCLTFWDTTIRFFKMTVPFGIPLRNMWEFQLLQIHASTWYCQAFFFFNCSKTYITHHLNEL